MATKFGLGKGLASMIQQGTAAAAAAQPANAPTSAHETATRPTGAPLQIPIEAIERNPFQPRTHFDEAGLEELTNSIRQLGVIQPVTVRRVGNGYQLISGERRLRAAKTAGLKEIPVTLVAAPDEQSLEMAMVENLQRRDLGPLEEAEGYRQLATRFNMTQDKIAERVGKARATVANAMRLLTLQPEVQAAVRDGKLSSGHAKLLAGIEIATEQVVIAREALEKKLSVRALENLIRKRLAAPRKPRATRDDFNKAHATLLTEKLQAYFGTHVTLVPSRTYANGQKAAGRLTVDFYSNEDLDRVLNLLKIRVD